MNSKTPKTLIDVLKHLYKLADDFPYSQLALCLDTKNLFDLIRVFGGQRLYIPTLQEFISLIQFCIVEEIGDYKTAVSANKEVLDGFSEAKYNKMFDRIHNGVDPAKERKENRRRKAKQNSRGQVEEGSQDGGGDGDR